MTPEIVERLFAGHVPTWQAHLEHLLAHPQGPAPRQVVAALLEKDPDFTAWIARAKEAAGQCESAYFATTLSAVRPFRAWLFDGLVAAFPDHPAVLDGRVELLSTNPPPNAAEEARAVLAEARKAWGPGPKLGQLLLTVHRRLGEEGLHDEALAAAQEAERLVQGTQVKHAQRLQAGTLLCLRRFDEAFALLDVLLEERGLLFGGGGTFVFQRPEGAAHQAALEEAASVASWASKRDPEWVRSLGGMAETSEDEAVRPALWERFDRALQELAAPSPDPDDESPLEIVIAQAKQRKFKELVKRACKRARSA